MIANIVCITIAVSHIAIPSGLINCTTELDITIIAISKVGIVLPATGCYKSLINALKDENIFVIIVSINTDDIKAPMYAKYFFPVNIVQALNMPPMPSAKPVSAVGILFILFIIIKLKKNL